MSSSANNKKVIIDQIGNKSFLDETGESNKSAVVKTLANNLSSPIYGSYKTPASNRIGNKSLRASVSLKSYDDNGVGGNKIGSVTLLGEENTIKDFDAGRDGKNISTITHLVRSNTPVISINREGILLENNQINYVASFNNFGVSKLFKSFDESKKVSIPFEDFPGILDPVAYVESGDYIMQYMIINDLTRNIDKFIDPDDGNGVIEVFEIRQSFANTSISDIQIKGIKGSLSNENFYSIGKGASPIDTKFEIDQKSYSLFEDAQDALYQEATFSPRLGYSLSGSFALPSPVPEEKRVMSPFNESIEDRKNSFSARLRNFISPDYSGVIETENIVPELGTRFRSANTGFIGTPNYVIISNDNFINAGTDSIAFISTNRN